MIFYTYCQSEMSGMYQLVKKWVAEGYPRGHDPRGPTPDGTVYWRYSFGDQKWIRYPKSEWSSTKYFYKILLLVSKIISVNHMISYNQYFE